MKKILLIALAFITMLLFSSPAKSQTNGGGRKYLKIQFSQPLGEYKDFYNVGFGIETGRMFLFDLGIANGVIVPGLDISFSNISLNFGKDYNYAGNFTTKSGVLLNYGVKLGPMITVGITEGLVADFAVQYAPTVVFSLGRKGLNPEKFEHNIVAEKSGYSVSFAHRVSLKADIRYNPFLFGVEFILGNTTLNYNKAIIPELSDPITLTDKKELGLGTLMLNFGFTF